jgi:hypothetical protein
MELGEREIGKESDRASVILHSKDVKVEDTRICIERC